MVLPAYDNHLHLSPSGRNIDALKEFKAAGGTGLTLVTLPYPEVMISDGSDFMRSFQITLSLAEKAKETGLKVNVAVGPYPVLLIPLAERFGLDKAEKMLIKGMEDAASLVADGKANCLGEIGRPHFPVDDPKIMESSNRILLRGMELAHEVDCPVIIHCESESYTDESLAALAREAGLDPGKVVKHSSPPWVKPEETHGVMPSIPASRSLMREALSKSDRFMIETDFIDDPQKPNAIMAVTSVPKRINGFHQSGELSEEQIHRICVDIPDSLYTR